MSGTAVGWQNNPSAFWVFLKEFLMPSSNIIHKSESEKWYCIGYKPEWKIRIATAVHVSKIITNSSDLHEYSTFLFI